MISENKEELWDVYTSERQLIGKTHRRGDVLPTGEYHIAVHVCILNSKNELLIQRRQPFKHGWPNMWDLSASGSVLAGETSSEAAEREAYEELGVKLDLMGTRPYFTVNFGNGFGDFFIVKQDIELSELKLQAEEVREAKWVSREEVLEMQDEGTMIPYLFLDKLFETMDFYDTKCNRVSKLSVGFATRKNLESWMSLMEVVRDNFPGLETEEKLEDYRKTVIKNIDRGSAICALEGNMVIGVLLFSTKYNMLCQMAVHPEFRRRKVATKMIELMLTKLDRSKDIVVETFREDDEKGVAPRALYASLGFIPGKPGESGGYPLQEFVLKGGMMHE